MKTTLWRTFIRCPGTRGLFLGAALALLTAGTGQARVEADPNKPYPVVAEAGPWLVIVTSYTGPQAQKYAHDFVIELRASYGLPAYVWNRGAEERRKQHEELERRRQQQIQFYQQMGLKPDMMPRLKTYRIEEQFAVLVGGYKDMNAARKALDHIKKLDPPKTVPLDELGIAGPDESDKDKKKTKLETSKINPFRTAFVVHNPVTPIEKPVEKPDPFLKELNADESYSLLKTTKPWTLVVKQYYLPATVQPAGSSHFMDKLLGHSGGAELDAMAKQAHEIARVLREHMKVEAYVLHTRWGSLITVGSYDSQHDPQLLQNQRVLANLQLNAQSGPSIQFFAQPMPMQVPRP